LNDILDFNYIFFCPEQQLAGSELLTSRIVVESSGTVLPMLALNIINLDKKKISISGLKEKLLSLSLTIHKTKLERLFLAELFSLGPML
jgi:hypothetical protein